MVMESFNSHSRQATGPNITAAPSAIVAPTFSSGRENDAFFLTSITSKQRNCLERLECHWHTAQASFAEALGINLPNARSGGRNYQNFANRALKAAGDGDDEKLTTEQELRDSMRAFDATWAELHQFSEKAPTNTGIFYQGIEAAASFGGADEDCVHESEQYSNHINSCFGFDRARLYAAAVSNHYGRLKSGGTRRGLKAVGSSRLPASMYYGDDAGDPEQELPSVAQSEDLKSRAIRLSHTGVILYVVPLHGAILQAFILFNGWVIDNVNIRGSDEQLMLPLLQQPDLDLMWEPSEYAVFRQITAQARSAALRFFYAAHPKTGVKSFFHWLASFASLWSLPCRACRKIMLNGYPPCYRDFRTLEAYHENCKAH